MQPMQHDMFAACILKVIWVIATIFFAIQATDRAYSMFFAVCDAFLYSIPVFIAFNIKKKMGANAILCTAICAAICYPL
ncbi:MAG: hypothetical protein HUJ51_00170 [Eggerthellaceae bacterium]|nr:hypothetical protein [Eggerthellaceae bacterium]